MDTEHIVSRFKEAGLICEVTTKPLRAFDKDIIQVDISRKLRGNHRLEFFRVWPGHEDNRAQVLGVDKKIAQVVLMLHEPKREFVEEIKKTKYTKVSAFQNVVKETKVAFWVKRTTPEGKRFFLAGLDERQLFICQLPKPCTTVQQAHACLKNPTVILAEGKQRGKTIRQGEWFFINVTEEEEKAISEGLKKKTLFIKKKEPIGRGGNPHVADERLEMRGHILDHGFAVRAGELFVRGKIRHKDHETVSFSSWRKVIRNMEPTAAGTAAAGVGWID
jgi:hypothetical protein